MKLNLGAGRVIFPVTPETQPEHLAPLPESAFEPGWVNVDHWPGAGIGEVVELFSYPWLRSSNGNPWNDNSVEEIYASHLVEHIPHEAKLTPLPDPNLARHYRDLAARLDGWFMFFYECWRVLKPGGTMNVLAPWGFSTGALQDPSHTRCILPATFQYLNAPTADAPFDYGVPCQFEMDLPVLRINPTWVEQTNGLNPTEMTIFASTYLNVASDIRVTLRAVKDA